MKVIEVNGRKYVGVAAERPRTCTGCAAHPRPAGDTFFMETCAKLCAQQTCCPSNAPWFIYKEQGA